MTKKTKIITIIASVVVAAYLIFLPYEMFQIRRDIGQAAYLNATTTVQVANAVIKTQVDATNFLAGMIASSTLKLK